MKYVKIKFALAVFGTLSYNAIAQDKVVGYVYNDLNQNDLKDKTEQGISNVAVSNGEQVVLTDSNGKYELPLGIDNIISVIKPTGYQVAVDKNNLPKFFYNYKPKGSP